MELSIAIPASRQAVAHVADTVAAQRTFDDYLSRRAAETIRAQKADLKALAMFLEEAGAPVLLYTAGPDRRVHIDNCAEALQKQPDHWAGISWGIVRAFVQWLLLEGYAIGTVNRRLSTVKKYCELSAQAGIIAPDALALIQTVKGYGYKEQQRIDEGRPISRVGEKKAEAVAIPRPAIEGLKEQPDTPQGRRDRLLMCLLLDHGLRVGEVAILERSAFDIAAGTVRFDRPKVSKTQTHILTPATYKALMAYINYGDCPPAGIIWRQSSRSGELTEQGWSTAGIAYRVRKLGEDAGLFGLSPHDCRHHWATYWSDKVDIIRLQEAGGWSSLSMPRRYIERAEIANKGMV